jgi:hypothetical protein
MKRHWIALLLLLVGCSFVASVQRRPFTVVEATISDMQRALREKRVTSREFVDSSDGPGTRTVTGPHIRVSSEIHADAFLRSVLYRKGIKTCPMKKCIIPGRSDSFAWLKTPIGRN